MDSQKNVPGALFVALGYLIFSTNGMWMILAPSGATPFSLSAFRMGIGACLLLCFLKLSKARFSFSTWNWKAIALYTGGTFAFQISFYHAVLAAGISVGTMVAVGTTPIFAGILSLIFLKKNPSRLWVLSTAIALMGLTLLSDSLEGLSLKTLFYPVLAGFFSGASLLAGPSATKHHNALEVASVCATLIALYMLPFFFLYPIDWVLSCRELMCVLILGFVNTFCGYFFIFKGFKSTDPATASSMTLIEPVGASLIGIVCFKEPCTPVSLLGLALILGAISLLAFESTVVSILKKAIQHLDIL